MINPKLILYFYAQLKPSNMDDPVNLIPFKTALTQLIEYYGYNPKEALKYLLEIEDELFISESRIRAINYNYRPNYRRYLQSDKWKEVRKAVKGYYKVCQECGTDNNLQVHHLSYEHLGREEFDELTLLCGSCHQKKHH